MLDNISKQSISDAIENLSQASICIENAKIEINSSLSGKTFDTYISVLNDINTNILTIKTRLEGLV